MIAMVLAQVGPLTAVTEALATAAGAGALLRAGGLFAMFAGAAVGLFLLERARRREDRNQ